MITGKKLFKLIISLAVGVVIAVLPPPMGLERIAMIYAGIFISTILMLVLQAADDWVAAIYAMIMCVITGVAKYNQAFAAFSGETIGLVIAVYVMASGISNSGLLKRISLKMMSIAPNTYPGQVLGCMFAGLAMTPLISSVVAKGNIMAPVATNVTELAGVPKRSKPALGLFFATFITTYILGNGFLSGSGNVAILMGFMSDDLSKPVLSWGGWFILALVWVVVLVVGTYLFSAKYCAPAAGEVQQLPDGYFKAKYRELGAWSGKEKYALLVLVITLLAWIFSSKLGVGSGTIAFLSVTLLAGGGLISPKDFITRTTWSIVFFIAMLLVVPSFLTSLGWSNVVSTALGPLLSPFVSNVWIFVPTIMIVNVLLRFVVVSQLASLAILLAIFTPLLPAAGISLAVMIWPLYMVGNCWYLPYQNGLIMAALSSAGGEYVTEKEFCWTSWVYVAMTIVAMMLSIPVWKIMGLC